MCSQGFVLTECRPNHKSISACNFERMFGIMTGMRKLTEPQAHRARAAIIEGRYPEGMKARCARCSKVAPVAEGKLVDVPRRATGPARAFLCPDCLEQRRGSAA